jgi:DnaD/phage-associated family protein
MMPSFSGFPARVGYTPVPDPLLGPLLEEMDDLDELKCALRLLHLLHHKKGSPRFVTFGELASDVTLLRSLGSDGGTALPWKGAAAAERVRSALDRCVARGLFLRVAVERQGLREELFLLNIPANRQAVARIGAGGLDIGPLPEAQPPAKAPKPPDIFKLYEENIGIITPLIAEELKDAESSYPREWIEDAFREAVARNKRSWRYIAAILRRWREEGRGHGEPEGYPRPATVRELFRRKRRFGPLA